MEKTLNILRGEVTGKTLFLILELGSGELVIVVKSGVVEELFVENGFKKELEIAHETSVITVLVLSEDGEETVVLLSLDVLAGGGLGEVVGSHDSTEESDSVEHTSKTHLKWYKFSVSFIDHQHVGRHINGEKVWTRFQMSQMKSLR